MIIRRKKCRNCTGIVVLIDEKIKVWKAIV